MLPPAGRQEVLRPLVPTAQGRGHLPQETGGFQAVPWVDVQMPGALIAYFSGAKPPWSKRDTWAPGLGCYPAWTHPLRTPRRDLCHQSSFPLRQASRSTMTGSWGQTPNDRELLQERASGNTHSKSSTSSPESPWLALTGTPRAAGLSPECVGPEGTDGKQREPLRVERPQLGRATRKPSALPVSVPILGLGLNETCLLGRHLLGPFKCSLHEALSTIGRVEMGDRARDRTKVSGGRGPVHSGVRGCHQSGLSLLEVLGSPL